MHPCKLDRLWKAWSGRAHEHECHQLLPYSYSPLDSVMLIMQPNGIKRAQRLETENLDLEHGSPTYRSIAFRVKMVEKEGSACWQGYWRLFFERDIGGYLIDILMFILWLGDDFPLLQIHLNNQGLLCCRQILYPLSHQESPMNGMGPNSFIRVHIVKWPPQSG